MFHFHGVEQVLHSTKIPLDEGGKTIGQEKLIARLSRELGRLIEQANHGRPDHMPMDEGIKGKLPDEKIR